MSEKNKTQGGKLPDKELLTDEDLMTIFGVSKSSLKRWRTNGSIYFFQLGSTCYYETKLLKKTIRERTHPYYKKKNKNSKLDTVHKKTNDKE